MRVALQEYEEYNNLPHWILGKIECLNIWVHLHSLVFSCNLSTACLIKNWVLLLSYLKTVQCKRNFNSYYNAWYYIQGSQGSILGNKVYEFSMAPIMGCTVYEYVVINIAHLRRQNSKFIFFQEELLKVLKYYNFYESNDKTALQRRVLHTALYHYTVQSASANVSFYKYNSNLRYFELWYSCRKWKTSVLKFLEYITLDSWKTWKVSLSLPCAMTYTLWRNVSIYCPFRTAINAIVIYISN